MKFKTPAAIALAAIFSFSSFAATTAQAGNNNWFYNNYDRYEDQAFDDDEYYDGEADEYVVYAPPPRYQRNRYQPNRWQRRQDRLRRWARRLNRKALRRAYRPDRQRLDDARRDGPDALPHRKQVKKRQIKKRRKLANVPLPRSKPYRLMPPQAPTAVSIVPAPVKNPALKKDVKIASVPNATTPAPVKAIPLKPKKLTAKIRQQKTRTTFKPIRIEVVKSPQIATLRQPRKVVQRPASNQLSCDKAKSIVSGFGFSSVTAQTCTGTIYDFTAKRDGKPYSVKVSSLSGELKGVKKIK